MGDWIKLKAADGFELAAWRATPEGTPKAGVVVIQEIFGVNHHIRAVTDRFAAAGYLAIAPAIFDRVQPGVELGYTPEGIQEGMTLAGKLDRDKIMQDVAAAVCDASSAGKAGIVGFCLGGSVAWASAAHTPGLAASVGYYGGQIVANKDYEPRVPTMLHFGEKDDHIPLAGVKEVGDLHPDVQIYLYPAGHGFHCDERGSYDEASAKTAWDRTLEFFGRHLG